MPSDDPTPSPFPPPLPVPAVAVPPTPPPYVPAPPGYGLPPPHTPIVPPHTTGFRWIVAAVVLLVAITLGTAGWMIFKARYIATLDPRVELSLEEKNRGVAAAFASPPVGAGTPQYAPIKSLLDAFQRATHQGSTVQLTPLCDGQRLFQEVERQGAYGELTYQQRRDNVKSIGATFTAGIVKHGGTLVWDRYQICQIQLTDGGDEALVSIRAYPAGGGVYKSRWWLYKRSGHWRIYDTESVESCNRRSTLYAASIGGFGSPSPNWNQAYQNATPAVAALNSGKMPQAEQFLQKMDGTTFPPPYEAFRWLDWADLRIGQHRYREALAFCDKAESSLPGMPQLDRMRAQCFNDLQEYDHAVASGLRFEAAVGPDGMGDELLGIAYDGLSRTEEAASAFRRALDVEPQRGYCLWALARDMGSGKLRGDDAQWTSELTTRFAQTPNPHVLFLAAAPGLDDAKTLHAFELLNAAYRRNNAGDPWLHYYEAEDKSRHKQYKEAAAILKGLLNQGENANESATFLSHFVTTSVLAGEAVEAYEAAADRRAVFRSLAGQMLWKKETAPLQRLIDVHVKQCPDDAWAHYYQAKLHEKAGKPDAAEREFALATANAATLSEADGRSARETIRSAYVRARSQAGRGLSAYADIGPKKPTFDQLAWHFSAENEADNLEQLIRARRADAASDADLPLWEAEVNFERKQYAQAAARLRSLAVARPASFKADEDGPSHWEDLLARSLLRANRLPEALAEARIVAQRDKDFRYLAAAEALSGHVSAAEKALDQCLEDGSDPEDLYDDDDLGPILKTPPFAAWRLKNPMPAKRPATTLPSDADDD